MSAAGATRRRSRPPRPADSRQAALLAAAAAWDKKAFDLLLLDVAELSGYTDYFLLASGRSTRQATAVAEAVRRTLKSAGLKAIGIDGVREGRWALLDYGDVVIHVFHQPVREFYDLESHWADAPRVELDPEELAAVLPPKE